MSYFRFPRYVSVGEKRARAEKKLKQLKKKNPDIQPVWVEGRTLVRTWWGKAWNQNLERYADFANRIGRGRSYLRHRAVLDLRIEPGRVHGLVQGSAAKPYSVAVKIKALNKKNWAAIKSACTGRIDSMNDLLAGRFPEALSALFTARGQGLFPSPQEIEFNCSCPDWADMCKHVAAILYGIGVKLDEDPALFFRLRKVAIGDLVSEAVAERANQLLEKAGAKSGAVIADEDLGDVFGIVMEERFDFGNAAAKPPSGKTRPAGKKKAPKKAPAKAAAKKKPAPSDNRVQILGLLEKAPSAGIGVPALAAKTGLSPARVRNIVYTACKKGLIEKAGRGLFRSRARKIPAGDQMARVLESIRSAPQSGLRAADIQGETDIPLTRVRNLLVRAMADGNIIRLSRGVYGPKKENTGTASATEMVLQAVSKAPKGMAFSAIREKTGLAEKKLRNVVFRLTKLGKIRRVSRGVYSAGSWAE